MRAALGTAGCKAKPLGHRGVGIAVGLIELFLGEPRSIDENCAADIDVREVCAVHPRAGQIGAAEIAFRKVAIAQIGAVKIRTAKGGAGEIGSRELRARQQAVVEIALRQAETLQIHAGELGPSKIDTAEIDVLAVFCLGVAHRARPQDRQCKAHILKTCIVAARIGKPAADERDQNIGEPTRRIARSCDALRHHQRGQAPVHLVRPEIGK